MAKRMLGGDEGETMSGVGGSVRLLLEREQSGGAMGAWVQTVPVGSGPPSHYHEDADEAGFVLSGEFEWTVDGETRKVGPGGFVFIPKGTLHGFKIVGESEGVGLFWVTPGGFEGYFRERVHLDPVADLDALTEVAKRFRMIVPLQPHA